MAGEHEDIEALPDARAVTAWLLRLRKQAGLSQEQAAEAASTTKREIRRWETESAPGGVNLLRLLSAYGVTLTPSPPDEVRSVTAELRQLRSDLSAQELFGFVPTLDMLTEEEISIFEAFGRAYLGGSIEAENEAMASVGLEIDAFEDAYNAIVEKVMADVRNARRATAARDRNVKKGAAADSPESQVLLESLRSLERSVDATRQLVAEALGLQERERELEAELQQLPADQQARAAEERNVP